jgi:Tfp pilus assembly PilM family ATPase
MQNPLSKQMFTTSDIRAIVQHPLGSGLRALQTEQDKLSGEVRPKTIEEMEKMAQALKELSDPAPTSSSVPVVAVSAEQSPIYTLASACRQRFEDLSHTLYSFSSDMSDQPTFDLDSTRNSIEDAKARFKAWATNIAAFRKGTVRTSLDFRLAEAPGIKGGTLQVLEDLEEYLVEGAFPMQLSRIATNCSNVNQWL